jgi:hypothetical protein
VFYHRFLLELEDYGLSSEHFMHEQMDMFEGLEANLQELVETHNYVGIYEG